MTEMTMADRLSRNRKFVIACYVVAAITCINWSADFGYTFLIGGIAPGTVPTAENFFVTSHGNKTTVDEQTWLTSLFYSTATGLEAVIGLGCIFFLTARYILRKSREKQRMKPAVQRVFLTVMAVFYLLWAALGFYVIIRDFAISWKAYCRI